VLQCSAAVVVVDVGSVCWQNFLGIKLDGDKLYIKVVGFVEICNFVVQTFLFEVENNDIKALFKLF
jgi:hypothetical protein